MSDAKTYSWPSGLPRPVKGIPVDEYGYVQSFGVNDEKAYLLFYQLYGFVVIHDILSAKECQETIDDIWSVAEQQSRSVVKRTDPSTWQDSKWSALGPLAVTEGMLGNGAIFTPIAIRNRYNPAILQIGQTILQQKNLLVNHDRYGIFRPTLPTKDNNNNKMEKSVSGTVENLHLDMNPWREVGDDMTKMMLESLTYQRPADFLEENNLPLTLPAIQMLVNLAENREQDGGLQVVPGFPTKQYKQWVHDSKAGLLDSGAHTIEDNFIRLDDDDPLHSQSVRVTARAGSLVVWDKRMVHGSKPNKSDRFRYAQFFLMFPSTNPCLARRKRIVEALRKAKFDHHSLPPHAKLMFGLA